MHALQANPYYCAGRVTVPAIIDTLSASFFNRHAPFPTTCCFVANRGLRLPSARESPPAVELLHQPLHCVKERT